MANYAYILNDTQSKQTLIIDAAEPDPIISKLEELNLTPSYILTTHHHFDHVGANETLKQNTICKSSLLKRIFQNPCRRYCRTRWGNNLHRLTGNNPDFSRRTYQRPPPVLHPQRKNAVHRRCII